jgi:adenosylhomocysteinase
MSTAAVNCDIKNVELADLGKKRIEWANQSMKVLQIIRKEFIKNQPLKGIRISACLHVTAETANLGICLRDGGAEVVLCASNPLSTQDDVAASLVRDHNIPVYAIKGEDNDTYYNHILAAIDHKPHITMDDGADLVTILHTKRTDALDDVIGGTEETTTGVIRLSSPSMMPTPSTCSTIATARDSRPSTALSAPPISCWLDRSSSWPATAGAAEDWPVARAATARK